MSNTKALRPAVIGGLATGLRRERQQSSPRFRDGKFHNTDPMGSLMKPGDALATTGEFLFGGSKRTPPGALPMVRPSWETRPETGLRATWLGHSTTLLEIDGARVLTDPVWGERASPFSWAGPRRFHRPPASLSELPDVDAVLVSHDHYDHLDHATVTTLAKRGLPFVTSLGVGAHLEAWGVPAERITELDWWEEARVSGVSFTAMPSRHFSGRGLGTRNATLWSSWAIRGERHQIFFSGDTGLTREFETIQARMGKFDLVMLEIGAFHPAWGEIHLGPENALKAHQMLGGGTLLPVHWGTFDLALHAWDDPIVTLIERAAKDSVHVVTPRLGRTIEPKRVEHVDAWWREVEAPVPIRTLATR